LEKAMNDELTKCYNLLGLRPGASSADLKAAHRDLAKVWHPDRFLHDPRLQQKAQEKLKEINEAYDQLRSGKVKRQTEPPASARERYAQANAQTVNVRLAPGIRWQLILAPVLIFVVAFLVVSRSLIRPGERADQTQVPAIEQARELSNPEPQQPGSVVNTPANEVPKGNDRIEAQSDREESDRASTSEPSVASLPPMRTVTVVIDPTTGMIARSTCPMKSKMTYPSGNEPHQYCTSHKAPPIPPAEVLAPTESRLKSAAKRLTSPGKWFGGKPKPDAGTPQDSKSP
jgi:DnaJ-like protein